METHDNETVAAAGPDGQTSSSNKRRKVRKGTRSCWECKRRKAKCVFDSSSEEGESPICAGCRRRRTPCVAQEFPEELAPARIGSRHLSHRISRVEEFMQELMTGHGTNSLDAASLPSPSFRPPPTPSESLEDPSPNATLEITQGSRDASDQTEKVVLQHLLAAFPSERDAKLLLRESVRPSLYILSANTQPHSDLRYETLASPCALMELPGPDTHPAITVRLMLLFAITLQSPSRKNLVNLSEPRDSLMRRLVTAATTWMTTQEVMQGTLDGLICIILEGLYEINCGNLRRAWLVYRRAMTVAQIMGIHRSHPPPLKRIDPALEAKPEFLWFRIVYMDRYLSLMLGLPQGTSDRSMAAPAVLQHESPLGIFERLLTAIASRILERNERPFSADEIAITQSIDAELLKASQNMPASFWRPANFQNLTPGSPETLLETMRLGAQVYYYGLLVQLHLPYTMRLQDNTVHDYSKITCISSSREIMMRFVTHRTFNPLSSCSRPVDFFALLAGMTLLLAHLDTHHHQEATNLMVHQRLTDRALLSQALDKMDVVSKANKDVITEKSASLLRRLLAIEADAADGNSYIARSVTSVDDLRKEDNEQDGPLSLHIPYFGIIKIARQGPISRESRLGNTAGRSDETSTVSRKEPLVGRGDLFSPMTDSSIANDQSLGSLMTHCSSISACPLVSGNQHGALESSICEQHPSADHENIVLQSQVEFPPIAAGVDDWNFQGVDTAFFDTLMRGTPSDDNIEFQHKWVDDPPWMDNGSHQS
ncbi:hypothetical protein F4680DRAFT_253649 [Xylaria scruposa]|nr:hypothetical protein F4680DRAFT_253649 [Xylaria scruposa]